jgi:hypothetical protein
VAGNEVGSTDCCCVRTVSDQKHHHADGYISWGKFEIHVESVEIRNQRLIIREMGSLGDVLALIILVIGAGREPATIAKRTPIVRKQWIAELLRQDVKFSG